MLSPRHIVCVSGVIVNFTVSFTVSLKLKLLSEQPVLLVAVMVYVIPFTNPIGVPLMVSLPVPWLVITTPVGRVGYTLNAAWLYSIGMDMIAPPRQMLWSGVIIGVSFTVSFTVRCNSAILSQRIPPRTTVS